MTAWHGRGWSDVLAAEEALALAARDGGGGRGATPEESSAVGRPPVWPVRIVVGADDVFYQEVRAPDAQTAVAYAASVVAGRDLSGLRPLHPAKEG